MDAAHSTIPRRLILPLAFGACVLLAGLVHAAASPALATLYSRAPVLASAFLYTADARLVGGAQPLEAGLADRLSPVEFTWTAGPRHGEHDIGFIAQEVEKVVPEVVHTDAAGMKFVDYPKLVPLLVKAVQENQLKIDELKAEVAARREALDGLQGQLPER